MEVTKTYPKHIEDERQQWLDMASQIKARYEKQANPSITDTATMFMSRPKTPEQLAALNAAYRAEIKPIVDRLGVLEGFATLRMKIDG